MSPVISTKTRSSRGVNRVGRLLGAGLLVAGVLVSTACGSSGQPAGSSSSTSVQALDLSQHGPITLLEGKDISGWTNKMIDGWNAEHPGEKVTLRELPSEADQQRQQLLRAAQVKDSEVAIETLDAVWTAEFAANGYIEALPSTDFPLEGFLPQTVKTVTYFGKVYAVPIATGGGLLYYRKDLLEQAGVAVPTTWAEMRDACAKIKKLPGSSKLGCYAGQFNKYEGLTVNTVEAIASAGGTIVTPEGQVQVASEQAKQGINFLVDSFRDGTIPKGAITWTEENGRQAFQSGDLIFLRNWSYVYALANKTDGSSKVAGEFDVAPLPGLAGPGVSSLGGNEYAITTFGKNKGTAADFIKYMTSPAAQKDYMLKSSTPPPLASVYTDSDVVKKYPYMPTLLKSIQTAQPRPVVVKYGDVTQAIQDSIYEVLQGQRSTDQGLDRLQSKLQALVKT